MAIDHKPISGSREILRDAALRAIDSASQANLDYLLQTNNALHGFFTGAAAGSWPKQQPTIQKIIDVTSQAAGSIEDVIDITTFDYETLTLAVEASAGNVTLAGEFAVDDEAAEFTYPATAFDIIATVAGSTKPKGRVKDGAGNDWGPYLKLTVTTTATADIVVYLVAQGAA